ncbi:MAG TPA: ATP-dependent DNA ligase [Pseudomonadales bacterium]
MSRLVEISRQVAATRSRLQKRALLAECLREAGPDLAPVVVSYLSGTLPQGRIGLGWRAVSALGATASAAATDADGAARLTVAEVDEAFRQLAETTGKGSQQARRQRLAALFARADAEERDFLVRLVIGELRQGALEGMLVEAIAEAAEVPVGEVRRAVMLAGEAAPVARAALAGGRAALGEFRLQPLVPVQPMLAQPAADMDEALATLGEAVLEYKLDGARVQAHKDGDRIRIYSRRLNDVTDSVPEVVEVLERLPARSVILDGEVLALGPDGRPQPFQVTMRRFGRKSEVAALRAALPLSLFLFDCLHHDGTDLIDEPLHARYERLAALTEPALRVPRTVTGDVATADEFLLRALAAGHEGVMAKAPASVYAAGSRGAAWLKVKQAHTLDLIVLAAEWGSGRRRGWLSNLHLGARDPAGGWVMLGKTFKGLTDEMLRWQTGRLLELEVGREGHVVHVRPELVVEVAFNEIQTSPQYPGGMALRFARVKAYRPDKSPEQCDTVETVRRIYELSAGARS